MCSINHELKAIYIHLPKTGGLYVQNILEQFYGFKTYYFTHENHQDYITNSNIPPENRGFLNITKKGIVRYYMTSQKHNELSNMTLQKWHEYYKFTFVRNPYERFVSGWKFIKLNNPCSVLSDTIDNFINNQDKLDNYDFMHCFISQYDHLVSDKELLEINKIANMENLNESLMTILSHLGITNFPHLAFIAQNKTYNKSTDCNPSHVYMNEFVLSFVNTHFKRDFEMFGYPIYNTLNELIEKCHDIYGFDDAKFKEQNKKIIQQFYETHHLITPQKLSNMQNVQLDNGLTINLSANIPCKSKRKVINPSFMTELFFKAFANLKSATISSTKK